MYQKIISEGSPSGRRPIWQHAVSIMGNHLLPNNKDTTKMTMMIIVMDFSYWKCTHRPFNLPFSKSNNQYLISGNPFQTDDDYQSRSSHQQAPCSDPVSVRPSCSSNSPWIFLSVSVCQPVQQGIVLVSSACQHILHFLLLSYRSVPKKEDLLRLCFWWRKVELQDFFELFIVACSVVKYKY